MTPLEHLGAQVARLAGTLLLLGDVPFLRDLAAPLSAPLDDPARLAAHVDALRADLARELAARPDLPLARLRAAFELGDLDLDLLLLAVLPELDDRFGALFAQLRGRADVRRPTLGLAFRALVDPGRRWAAWPTLRASRLWAAGLLLPQDEDLPAPDRTLRPSPMAVAALEGRVAPEVAGRAPVDLVDPRADDELDLAVAHWTSVAGQAGALAGWVEALPPGPALVHVTSEAVEHARLLAGALAHRLGRPWVRVRAVAAEPLAALRQGAVAAAVTGGLLSVELAPDVSRLELPQDLRLPGPTVLVTTPRCPVDAPRAWPLRRVAPERPRPREHAALWRRVLGDAAADVDVELLASQTWLQVTEVQRVVARARALAADPARPTGRDVARALAEAPEPSSALARVRRPQVAWEDLVLPAATLRALEDLARRVRHRVTVQDAWGLRAPDERGNGVVALLHGEPGTGKTLAAEALAARLGLPLVSVDLSQVVSKFIGETEKNLSQVFDAAEGYRAVLFFDEAESLFGKRTAVTSSHDRYANLETNYLLQRLEGLEGIALLATNLRQNLDDAFARRLHAIVGFARPSAALQQRLWERHLPRDPDAGPRARGEDLDLPALAGLDLVGGEIRNAALAAAYAAAAAPGPITQALALRAAREELEKRGRVAPRAGARDGPACFAPGAPVR